MKVRPKLVLEAIRIEREDQIRTVSDWNHLEFDPKIGDWIITRPDGKTFLWPDATFAERYEVV